MAVEVFFGCLPAPKERLGHPLHVDRLHALAALHRPNRRGQIRHIIQIHRVGDSHRK